jgi:hypothetical protein
VVIEKLQAKKSMHIKTFNYSENFFTVFAHLSEGTGILGFHQRVTDYFACLLPKSSVTPFSGKDCSNMPFK